MTIVFPTCSKSTSTQGITRWRNSVQRRLASCGAACSSGPPPLPATPSPRQSRCRRASRPWCRTAAHRSPSAPLPSVRLFSHWCAIAAAAAAAAGEAPDGRSGGGASWGRLRFVPRVLGPGCVSGRGGAARRHSCRAARWTRALSHINTRLR